MNKQNIDHKLTKTIITASDRILRELDISVCSLDEAETIKIKTNY